MILRVRFNDAAKDVRRFLRQFPAGRAKPHVGIDLGRSGRSCDVVGLYGELGCVNYGTLDPEQSQLDTRVGKDFFGALEGLD